MIIDQYDQWSHWSLWLLIRQLEWKLRSQLEGLDKDEISRSANERRYATDCRRVRHRHVEHFGHALHAPLYRLRHIPLVVRLRRGAAGRGGWERLRPRRVARKAPAVPGTRSRNVCCNGCLGIGSWRQNIRSAWGIFTNRYRHVGAEKCVLNWKSNARWKRWQGDQSAREPIRYFHLNVIVIPWRI